MFGIIIFDGWMWKLWNDFLSNSYGPRIEWKSTINTSAKEGQALKIFSGLWETMENIDGPF